MKTAIRVPFLVVILLCSVAALAQPQATREDRRSVFDPAALRGLRFEVASRGPLEGFAKPFEVLVLTRAVAEGQEKGIGPVSRVVILDGNRVEFDSFTWDKVADTVEPSLDTRTFFNVRVNVLKAATKGKPSYLVLAGLVPLQDIGQPVHTANRLLVLGHTPGHGFWEAVDAKSAKSAIVNYGNVRIDY